MVLEPGCASVFRDEIKNLLPATKTQNSSLTFLFSELQEGQAPDWRPPKLSRKAVMRGHWHQKSLMGMESDSALLEKLGVELQEIGSGCCEMAGSLASKKISIKS